MISQNRSTSILRILLVLAVAPVLLFAYKCFTYSYEELRLIVTPEKIYKTVWGAELEGTRFNPDRYLIFKYASLILSGFLIIVITSAFIKAQTIISFGNGLLKFLIHKLKEYFEAFQSLSFFQKFVSFILLLCILVFKIYLLFVVELNEDEVRSYEYFVAQGFWIITTYYPDTNNHVFFNEICLFFNQFINDPVMVMRIPALVANVLLLLLIFFYGLKKFGFNAAIIAVGLSAFIYETSYFGAIGRGHLWMTIFAFIAIFSSINITELSNRKIKLFLFVTSNLLGLYTVPTYIFILGSLIAFLAIQIIIKRDFKLIYDCGLALFFIGLGTFFLYLPFIIINGLSVLTSNRWTVPLTFSSLIKFYPIFSFELSEYILGIHTVIKKGYLLAYLLGLIFLWFTRTKDLDQNKKSWIWIMIVFFITQMIMVIILKILPPYRVFTYFIFIFHISVGILISYIIGRFIKNENLQNGIILGLLLVCIGIGWASYF